MDQEYVSLWTTKEKADELNKLKGVIPDDEILQKYIDDTKKNIKIDLDTLDYDMLQYKATMAKWHKTMKEAYDEMTDKSYSLWEEFDKNRPNFDQKMKSFVASVEPVNNMLNNISSNLSQINNFSIDKLLELVNRISCMSMKEKEMMQFLLTMEK